MVLREITIGRSKDCDVYLDPRCDCASSYHATIYMDGNQLMYRDRSRNGTMINNVGVHNRAVPIHYGDIIMIAGRYQLNWNQIMQFFPQGWQQQPVVEQPVNNTVKAATVDTSKWNWGAFGIYPIWGFFNGCWWAFFVGMFAGWLFPLPNIIFGVFGTRWAWKNKVWSSAQEFERAKKSWDVAGIVVVCINIVCVCVMSVFYMSLLSML